MQLKDLLNFTKTERERLLKHFQDSGKQLDSEKEILAHSVKLSEEVGELCNETLNYISLQRKSKLKKSQPEDLAEEIADVIITTLILAEGAGVNVNEALEKKIEKIKIRKSQ